MFFYDLKSGRKNASAHLRPEFDCIETGCKHANAYLQIDFMGKNLYDMELARRVGINVPETSLTPLQQIRGLPKDFESMGKYAYVIKRFDRKEDGQSVHIEDFAQIFNVYPEKKYRAASYRNLTEVIWLETGEKGLTE